MDRESNIKRIVREFISLYILMIGAIVGSMIIIDMIRGNHTNFQTKDFIIIPITLAVVHGFGSRNVHIVIENMESNKEKINSAFQKKKVKYIETRGNVQVYRTSMLRTTFWPVEIYMEEVNGNLEMDIPKILARQLQLGGLKGISYT